MDYILNYVNMKRIGKILLITLISVVGVLLIGLIVLFIKSPGKIDPLKDATGKEIVGSLVEKNFIEIGGIRQGFFIRGENPENPVLQIGRASCRERV